MSDDVDYAEVRAAWDRMKAARGYAAVRGNGRMTRAARSELLARLAEIEHMDRALGGADPAVNWREEVENVRCAIDDAPVGEPAEPADAVCDTHGALHRAAHDSYADMDADWARMEASPAYTGLWAGNALSHAEVAELQLALRAFGDRADHLACRRGDARAADWRRRLDELEHGLHGITRAAPPEDAVHVGRALADMDGALDRLSIVTGAKK